MDIKNLELDRVEIRKVKYDSHNRIKEEEWEFYYPPEKANKPIGFTNNKK